MGFPTPLRQWLREPEGVRLLDTLRDRNGLLAEYVNAAELEKVLDRQSAGVEDATDRIWRLLNLQLWGDLFITGRCRQRGDRLLTRAVPCRASASSAST